MPNCVSRANAARTTLSIERSFAFYFTHYAVYDGLLILIVFLIRLFFCCNKERTISWDILGCRIKKNSRSEMIRHWNYNINSE